MKKGFTLIELLVVVLIIGILSAIALPQYQVAVQKSRLMALVPLMKGMRDAQQLYYLNNGEYTNDMESLDISWPAGTNVTPQDEEGIRAFIYLPDGGFCESVSKQTTNWETRIICKPSNVSASLFVQYKTGEWRCYPEGTAQGKRLCKSMGCNPSTIDNLPSGAGCTFSF